MNPPAWIEPLKIYDDLFEAMTAFAEKRKPVFKGR